MTEKAPRRNVALVLAVVVLTVAASAAFVALMTRRQGVQRLASFMTPNTTDIKVGQVFPSLSVKPLDGSARALADVLQSNERTLVMVGSPSCHACELDLKDLREAMPRFKSVGFVWIISTTTPGFEAARQSLAQSGFTLFDDPEWKETSKFRISQYPTYFIVDRSGKVAYVQVGRVSSKDGNRLVVELGR